MIKTNKNNEREEVEGCIETNFDEVVPTFDGLNLRESLLRGIYALGFERPSEIQQRAILPVIKGRDTIAQAQSGTGKTATFSISCLEIIDIAVRECQVVVLAPTRDLAQQSQEVMLNLAAYMDGISIHACIGGRSARDDAKKLREGVHVVVGTPGRISHMMRNGCLRTNSLRLFILDEADELLGQGFQEQIKEMFQMVPESVQVGLFSATMPAEVLQLTESFMRDPVRILVKQGALTLDGISQFYVALEREDWKLDTLCDLYETVAVCQAIIFVNKRRQVEWLADRMAERDFTVSAMHGDMEQRERDLVLTEFRSGSSRVLIATDVLARGIDVQQVSLVINFDLPLNRENYIHRIGRGGRWGRKGVAINFITSRDAGYMRDIEQFYETQINELPVDIAKYL